LVTCSAAKRSNDPASSKARASPSLGFAMRLPRSRNQHRRGRMGSNPTGYDALDIRVSAVLQFSPRGLVLPTAGPLKHQQRNAKLTR
jgi:hypothetical protein